MHGHILLKCRYQNWRACVEHWQSTHPTIYTSPTVIFGYFQSLNRSYMGKKFSSGMQVMHATATALRKK
jgi:hypothetical protein